MNIRLKKGFTMKKINFCMIVVFSIMSFSTVVGVGIVDGDGKRVADVSQSLVATIKAVDDFTVRITRLISALDSELNIDNDAGIAAAADSAEGFLEEVKSREVPAGEAVEFLGTIAENMNVKGKGLADSLTAHVAE